MGLLEQTVRACRRQAFMDGIKETKIDDYNGFLSHVTKSRINSYYIHIPVDLAKRLGLKRGDLLEVVIKKADENNKKEYIVNVSEFGKT